MAEGVQQELDEVVADEEVFQFDTNNKPDIPIDPRDKDFAVLMIGEYIFKTYLDLQ